MNYEGRETNVLVEQLWDLRFGELVAPTTDVCRRLLLPHFEPVLATGQAARAPLINDFLPELFDRAERLCN